MMCGHRPAGGGDAFPASFAGMPRLVGNVFSSYRFRNPYAWIREHKLVRQQKTSTYAQRHGNGQLNYQKTPNNSIQMSPNSKSKEKKSENTKHSQGELFTSFTSASVIWPSAFLSTLIKIIYQNEDTLMEQHNSDGVHIAVGRLWGVTCRRRSGGASRSCCLWSAARSRAAHPCWSCPPASGGGGWACRTAPSRTPATPSSLHPKLQCG